MQKSVSILMIAAMLGVALGGCASSKKASNDPFSVGQSNAGVLLFGGEGLLEMKINGVSVNWSNPKGTILPAGKKEYEIAVFAQPGGGRGLIGSSRRFMVLGKVELNIESGKRYALMANEATGNFVLSIAFGSFTPVGEYRFNFHEYTGKIAHKKIAEFPAVKLESEAWNAYKYPALQSQE